jgi:hypothetical protein
MNQLIKKNRFQKFMKNKRKQTLKSQEIPDGLCLLANAISNNAFMIPKS